MAIPLMVRQNILTIDDIILGKNEVRLLKPKKKGKRYDLFEMIGKVKKVVA